MMKGTELSATEKKLLTKARRIVGKKVALAGLPVSMEVLCDIHHAMDLKQFRGIGKKTIDMLNRMFPKAEDVKIEVKSMTEREYNEAEGIRRSDLWKIEDSPEKFKYNLEHPVRWCSDLPVTR